MPSKNFYCLKCGKQFTPKEELKRLEDFKNPNCDCKEWLAVPDCWFLCDRLNCEYFADCVTISRTE